ncbi:type 2 isopentenyl-diphosphate Delta-isomerase [Methanolapillus ohkumae]|uniref:Isopentenyl-diphosphate delta-isomerase n=1 Tax=Methanolapillus ohkumae TaxID=3028298 RepID=A0AA96ZW29_9EURY|nr:Isopentenyl-diphosphate delta-isomerase [Methanosarcinaceae archaeon Am2]
MGETSRRKIEHLELCAHNHVESRKISAGFEDVLLIHRALPEISMNDIDMSVDFFGKTLSFPFLIASITGGHPETTSINAALAKAAEKIGIGIGVGSQRAAIDDQSQISSFQVVREIAPTAFVYSNIGAAQLLEYSLSKIESAVNMIKADAIAVHLNFLQEAIQPEGDRNAKGCLEKIEELCSVSSVPVFVKETGAGISREDALMLKKAGVAAIDVGGVGGTSWAGVEVYRARTSADSLREYLGELFWDFGIPTVSSIVECKVSVPIIATGGVRTGIDVAKSIALGATVGSAALPFVGAAFDGADAVYQKLDMIRQELKAAMFLTGCDTISDLSRANIAITGKTYEYLNQRGFHVRDYANKEML